VSFLKNLFFNRGITRGAWLAQSVEHVTLDLGVMGSSPALGVYLIKKKKLKRYYRKNEILE